MRNRKHNEGRFNGAAAFNNGKDGEKIHPTIDVKSVERRKATKSLGMALSIALLSCSSYACYLFILSHHRFIFKKDDIHKRSVLLPDLLGDESLFRRKVPKLSSFNDNKQYSAEDDLLFENPLESFETDECKAVKKWQTTHFPSCNIMHELDFAKATIVGGGGQVNTWKYTDDTIDGVTDLALRTLQMRYSYKMIKYTKWRVESLALERLTASPNVMNIFGYCGTSGLYEYTYQRNLRDQIQLQRKQKDGYPGNIDKTQLLRIAVDVAKGLADIHTFDGEYATIGHGDLAWDQVIFVDQVYKITDFNRGFLLRWNPKKRKTCTSPMYEEDDSTRWQAPEEYHPPYERTEKADVFALGHIFYSILTGLDAFEGNRTYQVEELVLKGKRPIIPKEILESQDPVHDALINAMEKCWVDDPEKRSTAKEVSDELTEVLDQIENEQKEINHIRWSLG